MTQQGVRRCPLCGGERAASNVDELSELRADIVRLRQRLEDLERGRPAEALPTPGQAEVQERIDRRLNSLSGGYGSDEGSGE
jgi:hypothetical protein